MFIIFPSSFRYASLINEITAKFFREIETKPADGWVHTGTKQGVDIYQKKVSNILISIRHNFCLLMIDEAGADIFINKFM
jgi:hypothetical protein